MCYNHLCPGIKGFWEVNMNLYKIDTHVHTAEVSACGKIKAKDLVQMYRDSGYYGVIITDHYCSEYFHSLRAKNWEEKVDSYLTGYRNALGEGKKVGLKVFLGMEIRFTENFNDYLVYGFDEDFLKNHRELYKLGLVKFKKLAEKEGLLVFQAHPFRPEIIPADPRFLDGVEVYNGNPRHNSRNHLAYSFASRNNLMMISGSDFHQVSELATGGIILPHAINTSKELVALMHEKRFIDNNLLIS